MLMLMFMCFDALCSAVWCMYHVDEQVRFSETSVDSKTARRHIWEETDVHGH